MERKVPEIMTDKPIFQSQRRHPLDEDIANGTFDPSQMEDTSESLIDQIEDADEAAELNQQLQEALKEGPVMVMTADGREREVHVPSQWEGKLSGMPFSIQATPAGQMMVFSIPHTLPITLAVSVKDEFSLFETAVSTDMGLAMAARPEDFSDDFKKQEEMRLTWFLGFLRTSLSRTRRSMADPEDETGAMMMISAEDQAFAQKRAETILTTLDRVCSRLSDALDLDNNPRVHRMALPQGNATLH